MNILKQDLVDIREKLLSRIREIVEYIYLFCSSKILPSLLYNIYVSLSIFHVPFFPFTCS